MLGNGRGHVLPNLLVVAPRLHDGAVPVPVVDGVGGWLLVEGGMKRTQLSLQ
jgi:hypothetical protein